MFDKLDAHNLVANFVPGAALTYALLASGFPSPSPDSLGAFVLVAFVAQGMASSIFALLKENAYISMPMTVLDP